MKNVDIKSLASLAGGALVALVALQASANDGWYGGSCDDHFAANPSSCDVCIEYKAADGSLWHKDGHPDYNDFSGPYPAPIPVPVDEVYDGSSTGSFSFFGNPVLSCDGLPIPLECGLTLNGEVRKTDGNLVSIRVSSGFVSGDGLCGLVSLSGFPWYIGENNQHSGYNSSSGIRIVNNGPYIGSIGPISFRVANPIPLFPDLVNISNAHLHDVEFNNNIGGSSSFSFSDVIVNSDESSTGCSIVGELVIQGNNNVTIHRNPLCP